MVKVAEDIYRSLKVVGSDAIAYLHSQLTCDLMGAFTYKRGLLLEPDGKLIDILHLYAIGDGVEIVASSLSIAEVEVRLRRFLLRTKATIQPNSALDLFIDENFNMVPGGSSEMLLNHEELLSLRILNGDIARGHDYQEALFPNALIDIDRYVSFTKGCYVGQEYVERTHSRGAAAPKALAIFGSNEPVEGAILRGEEEVGVALAGVEIANASVSEPLRDALIGKYGPYEYLFFGLYSRKMGSTVAASDGVDGVKIQLNASNQRGEQVDISRLS